MVTHLEAGSCPSVPALDRDTIYRMVRERDPGGIISKNLIGWMGSSTYEATGNAWNGSFYECIICHHEFTTLNGLNQHLKSPRRRSAADVDCDSQADRLCPTDQEDLYHCPNGGCQTDFKTLAGLANHLESETCGFMPFDTVQRRVGEMMRGGRLIC